MEKLKKIHFFEDADERDSRYFVRFYETGIEFQRIRGRNLYFHEFVSFIMSDKDTHKAIMKEFKKLCENKKVRHKFVVRDGMSGCADIYDYEYWSESEWSGTYFNAKRRNLIHISMEDKCVSNHMWCGYSNLAILLLFFMSKGYIYNPQEFIKPRKYWKARRAYKYVWVEKAYNKDLLSAQEIFDALMPPPPKAEEDDY